MYAKLVLKNAKRSAKDYLVYIVTMTICVTLFYSFLCISSSYYQPDIGSEYDFTILSDGMKMAICAITLFLLFLIWFVNNYMLRRKQKEFAIHYGHAADFLREKLRANMDAIPGYGLADGGRLCFKFSCGRAIQHPYYSENQNH